MHGIVGNDRASVPVVLCIQGGGALGAFPAGAALQLIANPRIKIMGATGTSSGAVTARALINGYVHGLQNGGEEAARAMATKNVKAIWNQLVHFQAEKLPVWYQTADLCFSQMESHLRQSFRDAASDFATRHQTEAPLLEFYKFAARNGVDLTPATDDTHPFLAVNATRHYQNRSIWKATANDEVLLRLNGMSATEQHKAVAASGCLDFSLPIDLFGDGHVYHDGAYSSPIPDPMGIAMLCAANNYTMVILRTRPEGSYAMEGQTEQSEDWKRAFFNVKMDQSIAEIRQAFPRLNLCIIEPEGLERKDAGFLNNEMRFDRYRMEERFAKGDKRAAEAVQNILGLQSVGTKVEKSSDLFGSMFTTWQVAASIALLPLTVWSMTPGSPHPDREPAGIHRQ